MFIVKIKRSSFYQIVYKVNGKKTSRSTGTSNESDAIKILEEFKKSLHNISQEIVLPPQQKDFHSLMEFKKECVERRKGITKNLEVLRRQSNQPNWRTFSKKVSKNSVDSLNLWLYVIGSRHFREKSFKKTLRAA